VRPGEPPPCGGSPAARGASSEEKTMLLGVMLLYVGVVLIVNGLWLVGASRAAEPAAAGASGAAAAPIILQDREVTVINVFTGFVGLVCATTLLIQGNQKADLASIRGGGFILLFAFTYLWVATNIYLGADGRAFGWYCLFVAVTAVAAGIYTFKDANGNDASIWLGIDWFAWAILWGMFFALLALGRPIGRITGTVAIVEGIATAWVFGFLLLQGTVSF
jgi:hypothetical protein